MRNKKWKTYQVDSPVYLRTNPGNPNWQTTVKTVDQLTEAEAKNELCLAMDLINKLLCYSHSAIDAAAKAKYAP